MSAYTKGRPVPVMAISRSGVTPEAPTFDSTQGLQGFDVSDRLESILTITKQLEKNLAQERARARKLQHDWSQAQAAYDHSIREAENRVRELSYSESRMKTRLQELESSDGEFKRKVESLSGDFKKAKDELEQFASERAALEAERDRALRQRSELENERASFQAAMAQARRESREQLDEALRELVVTRHQCMEAESKRDALAQRIVQMEDEAEALRQASRQEFRTASERMEQARMEVSRYRRKMARVMERTRKRMASLKARAERAATDARTEKSRAQALEAFSTFEKKRFDAVLAEIDQQIDGIRDVHGWDQAMAARRQMMDVIETGMLENPVALDELLAEYAEMREQAEAARRALDLQVNAIRAARQQRVIQTGPAEL